MMQPRWNTAILLKIYNGLNRRLMLKAWSSTNKVLPIGNQANNKKGH